MLSSIKRFAAASAAVIAVAMAACSPAAAEPALWVVKDEDSTLYLFGTVHILKPETQWRTAAIDKALTDSSELWIEVEADDPAVMQPLIMTYGIDKAAPLSSKLSAEEKARLDAAAQGLGVPPAALEPMRPWFAAISLAVVPMLKAGYDPRSGVESKLKEAATAAGKPIKALETPEQQIRFFADQPLEIERELLLSALDDIDDASILDELVAAWTAGDLDALDRLMTKEMKADYPELHEVLLTKRNQDWAEKIDTMLDGKGVALIAVGAGHLVGEDSVQVQLAKRGVTVERVQ